MAVSKRAALGTGFGVITGLLVLSTALAYRIQESFSQRSFAIHRQYVQEQESVTSLRRILYLAGITVRDYLLNPDGEKEQPYLQKIGELRMSADSLLAKLRNSHPERAAVRELGAHIDALWLALEETVRLDPRSKQSYDFLQQQIAPRRSAAGQILQELETANHAALTSSEQDFSATRTTAASNLMWLLASCLIVGVGVALFSLHYSDNLEAQAAARFDEVLEAKLELERLSKRLMDIQEEERRRLSRELHDEIVQNVAVLKIEITQALAAVQNSRARESLARARDLADRTVAEVRNISLLLRPSLLDDLGLDAALQWQTEDFRRRTGVACEYLENNVGASLPDAVKTCVYRVTQEALRNCEKHSRASKVVVELEQHPDHLSVRVQDDGCGFDQNERHYTSLGLLGMRERAAALGGDLRIESTAGQGTSVRLTLPVKDQGIQQITAVEAHAS